VSSKRKNLDKGEGGSKSSSNIQVLLIVTIVFVGIAIVPSILFDG